MHHEIALFVTPTHTGTEALAFMLRWIHLLAGITWVGLLYFFNLVNVPFMKQVDAATKPKIFQYLTMPTLQLFRWSAMLTVFVGFWYWSQVYVAADAHRVVSFPQLDIARIAGVRHEATGLRHPLVRGHGRQIVFDGEIGNLRSIRREHEPRQHEYRIDILCFHLGECRS